ncbi:MAG: SDR family oxidoreductase [Candidatus Sumerlaeaceae bacterium]|nr:SDR family oxidoreductase [Candidatus Sumerlaeaceae bacterium]
MSPRAISNASKLSSGRIAVITGVSRGLGCALAVELVQKGIAVVGVARTPPEKALAGFPSSRKALLEYCQCDVRDSLAVSEVFYRIEEKFGKIDVLVNNAGVGEFRSVDSTTEDLWRRTLETNLTGAFFCTRAALPLLRKAGGGLIVNVTSVAAVQGIKGLSAYSASKAGLLAFGRALAEELRPHNIHVCNVLPGAIATEFWEHAGDASGWDRSKMMKVRDAARILVEVICAYPRVVTEEIRLMPCIGLL